MSFRSKLLAPWVLALVVRSIRCFCTKKSVMLFFEDSFVFHAVVLIFFE